ncbi:hypothetical protein [Methylobacterium sp. J-090]|uniref:hypothetical protein n=1 Tax=Methylobacterium sp. J-090 TaxID=2836666 RepID=UPI001FB9A0A2|nr:hypothetical protein [Methylobacterium sp. J-090]MCJ2080160.1 hypothetical protein [Methylobacterium sp. J-090]
MTAIAIVPSNALVAAFPGVRRPGISIRVHEARARRAAAKAAKAAEPAPAATAYRPRVVVTTNGKFASVTGRPAGGGVPRTYQFAMVAAADRRRYAARPVVLVAMRAETIVAVEAFEAEDGARLAAWFDRAAIAADIRLAAHTAATTRAARAAIVADLSVAAPRTHRALVVDGRFDRAAVMTAAVTVARAHRARKGGTWAAAMSIALCAVWAGAKADRLATAH